jgi:hypothetical protein
MSTVIPPSPFRVRCDWCGTVHRGNHANCPGAVQQEWPKTLWVCDYCGAWFGNRYSSGWAPERPPLCKIKGYGRDQKRACGRPMRAVLVAPNDGREQ